MIADALSRFAGRLGTVRLESGSLSPSLCWSLRGLGFAVVCMDARAFEAVRHPLGFAPGDQAFRRGGTMARHYLHEAANALLTTVRVRILL